MVVGDRLGDWVVLLQELVEEVDDWEVFQELVMVVEE